MWPLSLGHIKFVYAMFVIATETFYKTLHGFDHFVHSAQSRLIVRCAYIYSFYFMIYVWKIANTQNEF